MKIPSLCKMNLRWKHAAAAACLMVSFPASAAPAADDAADAASMVHLDTVRVAARKAQPSGEVAGSVSVITRGDIEGQQAHDIADLVRDEPGVAVSREATRFGTRGFHVRGIDGNRIAVRLDGVPLPDGFAVGSFSNAGRDLIDPELVERIELLRGPASALYGSDALGGIIAIDTRDPGSFIREGNHRSQARIGYDSRDDGTRFGATGAWKSDSWAALVAASGRDGGTWENNADGQGPAANPGDSEARSGLFKLRGRHGFGTSRVLVERQREQIGTDVRTARFGSGQYATTDLLLGDDVAARNRALVGLNFESPWSFLDELDAMVYVQDADIHQGTIQRRIAAGPGGAPTLRERTFSIEQAQRGVQLTGRSQSRHGPVAASWVYGFEYTRNRIEELRDGTETNLVTGAVTSVILGERMPVRDFPNSVQSVGSLFVSAELDMGDSGYSLLPGLRWDRFEVDARSDALFAEDFPDLDLVDVKDERLTPKLALRRRLGESSELYLAYAEGFRAPPFSDVNIALNLPGFDYIVLPNPELRAERSNGIELGINVSREALTLRAALYENRYRDLIESRANLGVNDDGATVFQSVNRERARIRGFELDAQWRLGVLGDALRGLEARAALSWSEGDDTRRDQPLNSIAAPRLQVGLQRDESGAWPAWGVQFNVVQGKRNIDETTGPLFAPPGYATLDVRFGKRFGEHVRLDLRVNNLTDRQYWDWLALRGVRPANNPAPAFYTAPGRHLLASLAIDW